MRLRRFIVDGSTTSAGRLSEVRHNFRNYHIVERRVRTQPRLTETVEGLSLISNFVIMARLAEQEVSPFSGRGIVVHI